MLPRFAVAVVSFLLLVRPPFATAAAEGQPHAAGAAALLIGGKLTATELQRWAHLLDDPRPLSRATAARLASVSQAQPMAQPLHAALEKEEDALAAREMIRALGILSPGTADEGLFAAARRFEGALDADLVQAVALRGAPALALVPRVAGLDAAGAWRTFFGWATRNGTASLADAAGAAVASGKSDPWREILALAREEQVEVPDDSITRSLESTDAGVRRATLWHLLEVDHTKPAEGSPLARALAGVPEANGGGDRSTLLAYELLGRTWGRPARDWRETLAALTPEEARGIPATTHVRDRLRGPEREALMKARFADESERWVDSPNRGRLAHRNPPESVRTADTLPGLVEDTLAAAGCRGAGERWAVLEARHDATGKLEQIGMAPLTDLASGCQLAARALLLTAAIPGERPPRPREVDVRLLPLFPTQLGCAGEARPAPPRRVGDPRIEEPRKLRNVNPVYPSSAVGDRRQGVVILEAIINRKGCVSSARVLASNHRDLSGAALRAVAQWRYTPTFLDGVAVPVVMTVTVNFRLTTR
jgi:TonB family protein